MRASDGRGFDVVSILSEAHPDFPDAKAAAKVIEALGRILERADIDSEPLYKEAEGIEAHIRQLQKQAKGPKEEKESRDPLMYG